MRPASSRSATTARRTARSPRTRSTRRSRTAGRDSTRCSSVANPASSDCSAKAVRGGAARLGHRARRATAATSASSCSTAPAGASTNGTSRATCAKRRSPRCSACGCGRSNIRRSPTKSSIAASHYDPAHPAPTYFYVLFKPADGYMRALVRPGGPAYEAGLRTGDVIDKLDGRFWWEYGTYQTRAARVRRPAAQLRRRARRRSAARRSTSSSGRRSRAEQPGVSDHVARARPKQLAGRSHSPRSA